MFPTYSLIPTGSTSRREAIPDGSNVSVTDLPALNATLNAISTALLVTGYVFIRRGDRRRHKACMIAALTVSALFLTSYVIYHAQVGSVPFTRNRLDPDGLFRRPHPARDPRGRDRSPHPDHGVTRAVREVRQAPPHRTLDVALVAVCFGHGRHRLLDALSDVERAYGLAGLTGLRATGLRGCLTCRADTSLAAGASALRPPSIVPPPRPDPHLA